MNTLTVLTLALFAQPPLAGETPKVVVVECPAAGWPEVCSTPYPPAPEGVVYEPRDQVTITRSEWDAIVERSCRRDSRENRRRRR